MWACRSTQKAAPLHVRAGVMLCCNVFSFQEKVLQYDLRRTARSTMQISMCTRLWNFTGSAEPATRCFAFNAPFTAVKLRETPAPT
jgi:hypothetical protein